MLDSLLIKNFLVFEEIELKDLKRVNLIAGKNNTGKTALLEALRIYAATGDSTVVNNILSQRGNFKPSWASSYESLFNRKKLNEAKDKNGLISLQIENLIIKRINPDNDNTNFFYQIKVQNPYLLNPDVVSDNPMDKAIFLPFKNGLNRFDYLWQEIVLTPDEDIVMKIIRETVEPRLVRMDLSGHDVKVRLKDNSTPVSLKSLGDGVQRLLLLAIALVSAKDKILLIDEFEAGLHHSVQEKLWEMVFRYAQELNIQVFTTTHSEDTLKSFYYVASRNENKDEANYIRLQFDREGKHEALNYNTEQLGNILELNIEIR